MAEMFGGMPIPSPGQRRLPTRGGMGSGPIQGLQGAASPGRPGGGAAQVTRNAYANQNLQQRQQPFLNAQGGMTYAAGPAPNPMGHDGMGRSVYGWGPDGPILTPQTDYVQFGPGEGPGIPNAPRNTGPTAPNGPMGGLIGAFPMPGEVPEIPQIDDTAAVREAYARAKDTAGQQGRAAMDSLMDVQGARGIVGSGLGVNEAGGVIAEGARQLGDFNREQAIQRVENERQRQYANYQGRINQRGQNMNWWQMELERRRYNAGNSPYGHVQGEGVNPVPIPPPRY